MTRDEVFALLDQEKVARQQAEREAAAQVATATKRARFAKRHQSTAEGMVQLITTECNQARDAVEVAAKEVAVAAVARSSAEVEAMVQKQLAERLTDEVDYLADANAIERARQQCATARQHAAEAERTECQQTADRERKEAECVAEAQRRTHTEEMAAAEDRLHQEHLQQKQERSRADVSEARCSVLEEENTTLLSKLAAANEEIRQLQQRLDDSIDKDDMPAFVRSLQVPAGCP